MNPSINYPDDRKYCLEHTWAKCEGDLATIGITYYAQEQLGEVLFVELPQVGDEVIKGEAFGVVESAKVASDLIAPLSGEIIEVNERLEDEPELINEDPYNMGWIIKIMVEDDAEWNSLLESKKYAIKIDQQ
ncbi:MAG: glycine cleavage system protein GcvH [bacterium]|jgi:glycine cleavage system H protein